jgi:hypothetical protein
MLPHHMIPRFCHLTQLQIIKIQNQISRPFHLGFGSNLGLVQNLAVTLALASI